MNSRKVLKKGNVITSWACDSGFNYPNDSEGYLAEFEGAYYTYTLKEGLLMSFRKVLNPKGFIKEAIEGYKE